MPNKPQTKAHLTVKIWVVAHLQAKKVACSLHSFHDKCMICSNDIGAVDLGYLVSSFETRKLGKDDHSFG
jgi:hypothetical protein